MLIRVEQGKGGKDRYAMLSPRLLEVLRVYFRAARPAEYLFPSWRSGRHLCACSLQNACREACLRSGLRKRVTAHTLRHYAASRTMPRGSKGTGPRPPKYRVACARTIQHAALSGGLGSELFKEGEQLVVRLKTFWGAFHWIGLGQRLFFQRKVGIQIDLSGFHRLMAEPQRDHRSIHTGL